MFNTPDEIGALDVRVKGAKNGVCPLDATALVPLANLPGILTGKDADTIDTFHAGNASGQVPVSNGTLNVNLNAEMVGGVKRADLPGALIWNKLISGSAVTSVTTDGEVTLDGNAHGGYIYEFIIYNPTGGIILPRLYYNNDTTNTNYDHVTDPSGWANDAIIGYHSGIAAVEEASINGFISVTPRGYVSAKWFHVTSDTTWISGVGAHHKRATVTNLTRLDIVSSVASGIGINSRFRLWRRI